MSLNLGSNPNFLQYAEYHVNPLTLGQAHIDAWALRGITDTNVVLNKDFLDLIRLYFFNRTDYKNTLKSFSFPILKQILTTNPTTGEAPNVPFNPPANVQKEVRYYFERLLFNRDPDYKQSETFVFMPDDVFRLLVGNLRQKQVREWNTVDYERDLYDLPNFKRRWKSIIKNMKDLLPQVKNTTVSWVGGPQHSSGAPQHDGPKLTKAMYLQAGEKTGRQWIQKIYENEPFKYKDNWYERWFRIFTITDYAIWPLPEGVYRMGQQTLKKPTLLDSGDTPRPSARILWTRYENSPRF